MNDENDTVATFLSEWATAETKADTELLDTMLADEFVAVGPLGFTLSKKDWIARHASGDLSYSTVEFDEVRQRHYGEVAVVHARQVNNATYQGNPVPTTLRVTLVLLRHAGSWQLANAHMSFVAGTPGAPPIPARRGGR